MWFLWFAPVWILVWGAIAAVILSAKGFEWWMGFLLGLFGPLGVIVAAVAKAETSERLPPPPIGAQWVEDPTRRHELRLWDGRQWTAHVSDRGVAGHDPV